MPTETDYYLELYERAEKEWTEAKRNPYQLGWILGTASSRPTRTGNPERDRRESRLIQTARRILLSRPATADLLRMEIMLRDRAAFGTTAR